MNISIDGRQNKSSRCLCHGWKRVVNDLSKRGNEGASVKLELAAGLENVVVIVVVMQRLLEAVRHGFLVVQQSSQVFYLFLQMVDSRR